MHPIAQTERYRRDPVRPPSSSNETQLRQRPPIPCRLVIRYSRLCIAEKDQAVGTLAPNSGKTVMYQLACKKIAISEEKASAPSTFGRSSIDGQWRSRILVW